MNCLTVNFIITIINSLFVSACLLLSHSNESRYTKKTTRSIINLYLIVSFIQLAFIRTFVDIHSVPDLENYIDTFNYLKNNPVSSLFVTTGEKTNELGFRLLMWIVGALGGTFRLFLFVVASIYLYFYRTAIKKYSPSVILSVLFLLLTSFNQSIYILRQHLAMAVLLLSYDYIIERKIFKYLFTCLVAVLFHTSALVWIPVYFIYGIKNKIALVSLIVVVGGVLSLYWQELLVYVGSDLLIGYASYLDSDIVSNSVGAFISLSYLVIFLVLMRKNAFSDGINRLLLITCSFALILTIIGIGFNPTSRLALYFASSQFLLIPIIIKKVKGFVLKGGIIIVIGALQYYITFMGTKFSVLEDIKLSLF